MFELNNVLYFIELEPQIYKRYARFHSSFMIFSKVTTLSDRLSTHFPLFRFAQCLRERVVSALWFNSSDLIMQESGFNSIQCSTDRCGHWYQAHKFNCMFNKLNKVDHICSEKQQCITHIECLNNKQLVTFPVLGLNSCMFYPVVNQTDSLILIRKAKIKQNWLLSILERFIPLDWSKAPINPSHLCPINPFCSLGENPIFYEWKNPYLHQNIFIVKI